MDNKRNARGSQSAGAPTDKVSATNTHSTTTTDNCTLTREQFTQWHNWLSDAHDVERTRLGFAVFVSTAAGTYRRRLYLSLESAYRAIERAELRGVEAHAVMVELRQVGEMR